MTIVSAIALTSSTGHAQIELKNDGFVDGQAAGFQAGFVVGEHGASTFVPSGTGPFTVTKVQLLFGGDTATETVTLRIYDDSAGVANPGAELFNSDYDLTGANDALSEIDLSADNVVVPGQFRVGLEFQHAGLPSIARDNDGNDNPTRNWINASGGVGWVQSSLLGLQGDWVIRAFIDGNGGGGPDAGPGDGDGDGDACALNSDCTNGQYCGADDTCTFDCRVDIDCEGSDVCNAVGQCETGTSDVGCGCSSSGGGPAGGLFLLALCVLGLRRRR